MAKLFSKEDLVLLGQLTRFGALAYLVYSQGVSLVLCRGPSMMPTMRESGDVILVDRASIHWSPLQRNEIVDAESPVKPGQSVCKRVVALAGDVVRNDRTVIIVPAGHVWLEGDNTRNSHDSRYYGPIPEALVRGRAVARVWPPHRWVRFSSTTTPKPPTDEGVVVDAAAR